MFQEYLLKYIGKITKLTVTLFGLWSYCFDSNTKKFTINVFLLIYSLIFPLASITAYNFYGAEIFADENDVKGSFAIHFIGVLFSNSITALYITLYIGRYFKYTRVKKFIINGIKICTSVDISGDSYVSFLNMYLVKSLVYDCLCNYLVIADFFPKSTSPYACFSGTIFIIVPQVVVRVLPNLYYGCMLGGQFYFRKINKRIKFLCVGIRKGVKNRTERNYVCNQLDKLSLDHLKLTKLINECNELCSLQVVIYVISQIVALLYEILLHFILLKQNDQYLVNDVTFNISRFVIQIGDLYATFAACDHIMREVIICL